MNRKIIVFEEISRAHRWVIRWYLLRGFEIYYYRINSSAKEKAWCKKIIADRSIIKIDNKYDFLSIAIGFCPDLAYKNIDRISENIIDGDEVVGRLINLYGDSLISNAFKKNLLGELHRFYYLNHIRHMLNALFPDRAVHFVYTLGKELHRTYVVDIDTYRSLKDLIVKSRAFCYEDDNAIFPLWFVVSSRMNRLAMLALTVAKAFGLFIWSALCPFLNMTRRPGPLRGHYRFGIMVISPARQFANKIQKIDFLMDGKNINKANTLFISWRRLPRIYKEYMRNNSLNLADNLLMDIRWSASNEVIPQLLFLLGRIFEYRRRLFLVDSALAQLACYAIWKSFGDRYDIDNLITHADFGLQSISRNIILSKRLTPHPTTLAGFRPRACAGASTKTWVYIDAISWNNFFFTKSDPANIARYSHMLGFLNYDYVISWSDEVIEYFKLHHQDIGHYVNVGCLWSQHVKEIAGGRIKSAIRENLSKNGFKEGYKLIAVFDSTYTHYLTTYEDGISFLKDIHRLLEEMPSIFILLKEKKPRSFVGTKSKEMLFWLKLLEKHPRCYLPLSRVNTAEAIASSDLTVSYSFTSPTFEALSARKKAIYHDPTAKFRDTFYDKIPGLTCHDYHELTSRVRELLFETSEKDYSEYLDIFVKGKVEPYLDGNALTRFRNLLTSGDRALDKPAEAVLIT